MMPMTMSILMAMMNDNNADNDDIDDDKHMIMMTKTAMVMMPDDVTMTTTMTTNYDNVFTLDSHDRDVSICLHRVYPLTVLCNHHIAAPTGPGAVVLTKLLHQLGRGP